MSTFSLANPHLFGIRHHGPGSARALRQALTDLQPDIVLVEGPPDADGVLRWLNHQEMEPPIALLVYRPDKPKQAAYYPMVVFSPEYQAIYYALEQGVPVRFMDLPHSHRFALREEAVPEEEQPDVESPNSEKVNPQAQAMRALADAAGYPDHESWWNSMIEQRRDSADLFAAILEVMTAVRAEAEANTAAAAPNGLTGFEPQREAWMRQTIRKAQKEGYERIAVVCGAWHTPALAQMESAAHDKAILKGLPKVKTTATWVPWTYGRLANRSGYGAGINSPGWYDHLWRMGQTGRTPTESSIEWLTRVAHLLRGEQLDASSAQIIDAVRLAEAMAAVRGVPLAGLEELNEAAQSVLCFGSDMPMKLIQKKLIVGEMMGDVPPGTPMVPLQRNLHAEQKRLRLRPEPEPSTLNLDLRQELHLERSHLLHRLDVLGIPWGRPQRVRGKQGTSHEVWRLQWMPDFAVFVIEAALWGNTVLDAATAYAQDAAERATNLTALTELLNRIILAELPDTVAHLMRRIEETAALSNDIPLMMDALPPLAQILRYGNVRQSDTAMVRHVVDGMLTRICIGLPHACSSLNEEAARAMFERVNGVHSVVAVLQDAAHKDAWHAVLTKLADQPDLHGLLAGRACRLLLDGGVFGKAEAARRMGLALSGVSGWGVRGKMVAAPLTKREPVPAAAYWVEGFLTGSGLLLLHDKDLWGVVDEWVCRLKMDDFTNTLPLLRRTFSTFSEPERRRLGELVRLERPGGDAAEVPSLRRFNQQRADEVLPLVGQLLGLSPH